VVLQAHYEGELDILDEYIARIHRSNIVCNSNGGGDSRVFETQLDRTAAALSNSLPQLLLQMQSQVGESTSSPLPYLAQPLCVFD
jgi:hypothetical protein